MEKIAVSNEIIISALDQLVDNSIGGEQYDVIETTISYDRVCLAFVGSLAASDVFIHFLMDAARSHDELLYGGILSAILSGGHKSDQLGRSNIEIWPLLQIEDPETLKVELKERGLVEDDF